MLELLHKIPLFQNLTENQLLCLMNGTEKWLNPGDFLFKQGEPAKCFYVVFEGAIRLTREISNQEVVLATYEAGTFFGEVPLLAGTLHLASGQAVGQCHVYCLHEDEFWQMLMFCPSVRQAVLGFMASRMQELQMLSQQHDKLISLGTLAAGLAHELGNPVAAARRATGQLHDTVNVLHNLSLESIKQHLTPDQLEYLLEIKRKGIEQTVQLSDFDPSVQMDLEDELGNWLESYDVANGWKVIPTLVAAGVNAQQLGVIGDQVSANVLNDILTWLEATLAVASVVNVLDQGVTRISELVNAVKSYSYMDQSPLKEVVVHKGIENTLTILSYKLKKHRVQVIREYEQNLPIIEAYGSALNQVWTNLIDNAIDALGEGGTIWVRTSSQKNDIMVEIADNGPGIPPEIQSRIFDPFFTTKGIGVGTGLGLEIAYRIIVGQHSGEIRCFSKPGDTRFQVRLPIRPFQEINKPKTEAAFA
ncbi:cyclic nucleotide-binding domain-containing protein [Scytonema sp. UIC 10036]|uniref:ATP-binding protein n=1 Tax=Scytonema sp. UIC 10036 TaxID=2304196 RepID=UPI0012DA8854|nr:ATP-binding protein [Scytonema sp. UIC 10036]MUG99126.1 cyclic nucleotide-binding domain-containing protein [Scytonema sp. UIC 10036]